MTVICPGDPVEVRLALCAALKHGGPVYMRLGKKGEPIIHKTDPQFTIGKGIVIREGRDVCLLSTGNMLPEAVTAADQLSAQLVSFHTVKPLDEALLADVFARFKIVATIEEHSVLGGLGGSVAEWLSDRPPQKARLLRIGTPDTFLHEAGEQEYAREVFGLTGKHIAGKILQATR
jgi:transketolase